MNLDTLDSRSKVRILSAGCPAMVTDHLIQHGCSVSPPAAGRMDSLAGLDSVNRSASWSLRSSFPSLLFALDSYLSSSCLHVSFDRRCSVALYFKGAFATLIPGAKAFGGLDAHQSLCLSMAQMFFFAPVSFHLLCTGHRRRPSHHAACQHPRVTNVSSPLRLLGPHHLASSLSLCRFCSHTKA